MDERRDVGGLRDKGSQGIHGQHNSMQREELFESDPHPSFDSIFRVLSPWSGL